MLHSPICRPELNRVPHPLSSAACFRNYGSVSNASSPTNQHISVQPDGKVMIDLIFTEEPVGMPASEGYGWPQFEFGEVFGPDQRYVIVRKLGWGMFSSTWMARDQKRHKYVAVKALTGYATELVDGQYTWEPTILQRISRPSNPHCIKLISAPFIVPGKGSAGNHMCLVTPLLGGDVRSLRAQQDKPFPLSLSKRILLHVLRGLDHLHRRGGVHTDLKWDNFFFDHGMTALDIKRHLVSEPASLNPPEASHDGILQSAVSQPLPIPTLDEAMQRTFILADFGCAYPRFLQNDHQISPPSLRAPEVFLGAVWDEKVDIWSFGCLVSKSPIFPSCFCELTRPLEIYELVTGRILFRHEENTTQMLDSEENMLYQMLCYTCEDFKSEQLSVSPRAGNYFDSTCNLVANPEVVGCPFELCIEAHGILEEADIAPIAALMKRCMRLDPKNRASAEELLADPWFTGVE
ncbi:Serine/threonine-protein kinase SRPK [Leucoagaricus sp. SymC.cos]|nr:Serine/threonine-protein kinase SRPK [Leucoagaricus sp. SymC.cos]